MDKFIVSSLFYGLFAIFILSGSLCHGAGAGDARPKDDGNIECYTCSSNFTMNGEQDPCILGDKSLAVKTCTGKDMACVKVYTKIYKISNGGVQWEDSPTVVSRFCDTPLEYSLGCTGFDANKGNQNICFCDSDKCNGASNLVLSLSFTLITSLAALFFC